MGKVAVYTWTASDAAAVAALQTTAGAGSLVLNGTLTRGNASRGPIIVSFGTVSRTVSLTSTNNLSAINVTVTGKLMGNIVTQTIAGPNNNTVSTTQFFDTVTSVTVSGIVTAMSVGSGTTGQTQWFPYDIFATHPSLTAQADVTGTVAYSFAATLDDVVTNANPTVFDGIVMPKPAGVATGDYETVMNGATTSQMASISYPIRYCCFIVAATGSIVFSLLQAGIK